MKCIPARRTALRQSRPIVLTVTVLVTGFVFWCLIQQDRSLVPDGPSWQISDVLMSKVNDEDIQNMIGLLQNKLNDLQKLAMIKYSNVEKKCESTDKDTTKWHEAKQHLKILPEKPQEFAFGKHRYKMNNYILFSIIDLCIDSNCPDTLVPQMSPQNILSILKPLVRVGKDKLRKATDAFEVKPQGKKYTFVTAASHNHFHESRVAMETLRKTVLPYISNYSLIFYDLGLCNSELDIVRNTYGFEVRTFPFEKLPNRARYLFCYTWKPLIVLANLPHTEVLVWMDSSIQTKQKMVPALINVTKTGILIGSDGFQFPQHAMLKMFSYFGDRPCHFSKYEELEANFLIFHNEPFVRQLIIEPWAACALDPTCMCPHESRSLLICPSMHKYGKCHRYDQATIGYIIHKLFREAEASVILQPKEAHEVIRLDYPLKNPDIFCLVRKGLAWLVG